MVSPLTRAYGAFLARLRPADLPSASLAVGRLGFTDAIGVLLAGREEPVVTALRRALQADGAGGGTPALLGRARTSASNAALLDATAAHALDFDDFAFSNHPSAVIVPAVLAAAAVSGADGARMAAAYVGGYEVWCDLFMREPDHFYARGWHPTAVLGPVGAAAAAAVAMGLDETGCINALAIAASFGGGVFENFGTMAKPLHGGRAAASGVSAAILAASGMTAAPTALEGASGLMLALSPERRVNREAPSRLGEVWHSAARGLNTKRHPVVGAAQRAADMAIGLRTAGSPTDAAEIARIEVEVSERHARVMPFVIPSTGLEAKFSLPFILACGLRHGRVGLAEVSDAGATDPGLAALSRLVEVRTTDAADPDWPDAAPSDVLVVHARDGRRFEAPPLRRARARRQSPDSGGAAREVPGLRPPRRREG